MKQSNRKSLSRNLISIMGAAGTVGFLAVPVVMQITSNPTFLSELAGSPAVAQTTTVAQPTLGQSPAAVQGQTSPGTQQGSGQTSLGTQQTPGQNTLGNQQTPGQNTLGNQQIPGQNTLGNQQVPGQGTTGNQLPGQSTIGTQQNLGEPTTGAQQLPQTNQTSQINQPLGSQNPSGLQSTPAGGILRIPANQSTAGTQIRRDVVSPGVVVTPNRITSTSRQTTTGTAQQVPQFTQGNQQISGQPTRVGQQSVTVGQQPANQPTVSQPASTQATGINQAGYGQTTSAVPQQSGDQVSQTQQTSPSQYSQAVRALW